MNTHSETPDERAQRLADQWEDEHPRDNSLAKMVFWSASLVAILAGYNLPVIFNAVRQFFGG